VVTAQHLNEERSRIDTQTGASTYTFNASDIQSAPGGDNVQLNQVMLQVPDAAQDSFGQLHIRGDHNGLQFRLNGVILPDGISVFGQTLPPRMIASMKLITGSLPAEYGLSWILPRLIGYGRAAEWLFSSRVVLSEEAQAMGLLHSVHPPEEVLEATLAYARALVDEAAPSSLRTAKRQLTWDLFRPLAESAAEASRLVEDMIGSDDYRQGIKALIEKRPPGFAERYKG